ncbi:MAG: hypothetical protein WDM78_23715 [Puia sp.]
MGKGRAHAFLYGFFIFLIYVLLSLPFHLLDHTDPEILNNISTNVWLNLPLLRDIRGFCHFILWIF